MTAVAERHPIAQFPSQFGVMLKGLDMMSMQLDTCRAATLANGLIAADNGPRPSSVPTSAILPPGRIAFKEGMLGSVKPMLPYSRAFR
jgi:hypothetical protein